MGNDSRAATTSTPLVALAGWALPGAGYVLIGQRARGIIIGVTIITLFLSGLLIGGVRVIEVPGYNSDTGERVLVDVMVPAVDSHGNKGVAPRMVPAIDPKTNQPILDRAGNPRNEPLKQWVMQESLLNEIRDKPWSVPQVLAGPIAIAAGYGSVAAAAEDPATQQKNSNGESIPHTGSPVGAPTHARINEIGSLYLSVAGLLNLMAIIDSGWRSSQMNESVSPEKETA